MVVGGAALGLRAGVRRGRVARATASASTTPQIAVAPVAAPRSSAPPPAPVAVDAAPTPAPAPAAAKPATEEPDATEEDTEEAYANEADTAAKAEEDADTSGRTKSAARPPRASFRRPTTRSCSRSGERLLRAERFAEARGIFEKLAKSKRERGPALVGLAEISFQEKRYERRR